MSSPKVLRLSSNNFRIKSMNDILVTLILFLFGVLTRIPFRSQMLHHWDSVNFALGMEQFDVRMHQPHPPGYYLYVVLARLVNLLVGDANSSLVWISVFFSGATIAMLYLLGKELFGRRVGVVAAVIALTSPSIWFFGEVALTYIVEAFLVTAIAYACLKALRGDDLSAVWSGILLGVAGGIRQTTLILMLPLWLFSLYRSTWRIRLLSTLLLVLTVALWFVPTVKLSGGLSSYLEASNSIGQGVFINLELMSGEFSPIRPFARLAVYLVYGLMLGVLPLIYVFIKELPKGRAWIKHLRHDDRAHVFFLWLIPNLILYAPLVRSPGHTFSFIPALVILSASALMILCEDLAHRLAIQLRDVAITVMIILTIVNIAFFFGAPQYLFDVHKVITTTPSWTTIRQRDQYLSTRLTYIRGSFKPASTIIVSDGVDFRHPDYYLRDYQTIHNDSSSFQDLVSTEFHTLVFFMDEIESPKDSLQSVELSNGDLLFFLQVNQEGEISEG